MKRFILFLIIGLSVLLFTFLHLPTTTGASTEESWHIVENGDILQIHYGSERLGWPQYGALHLDSSYFRLNYGPNSAWDTSVILLPAFWSSGTYYQGASINATPINATPINTNTWEVKGTLVLSLTGFIGGLNVSSKVSLSPPKKDEYISAKVQTDVAGNVTLDPDRIASHEAFKPVMLSSMHISDTRWDTRITYAYLRTAPIPSNNSIFNPPVYANTFGLKGGTSDWQIEQQQGKPAPTIEVWLDRPMKITGWVTPSNDPNDDNIGFWAASDQVISSWHYILWAAAEPRPKTRCISMGKEASPSLVQDGEQLTYTIHITNTTDVDLTATITDILPSQVEPNGVLSWGPITIESGGVWTQPFIVTAQEGYTGELRNRMQVTTEEGPIGWAGVTVCVNQCLYYIPIILK